MSPPQSISPSQHYPRNIGSNPPIPSCHGTVCISQASTRIYGKWMASGWQVDGKWMATGTKKYKEARAELCTTFSHFPLSLVPEPPKPFQPRLNQPCPPWGNRIGDLEMYAACCSYPKPQSCGQHCCGFLLHSKHSKLLSLVKKRKNMQTVSASG